MPDLPKILVVGGVETFVFGTFAGKLEAAGAKVTWHVSSEVSRFPGIPEACDGLIIIKDFCGHHLANPAKSEAKVRGIPYPPVSRKWAEAEPVLRVHGILPPAFNGQIQQGTDEAVLPLATEYVTEQREAGRYPKRDEVEAVMQRVYGPGYRLPEPLFKKVMVATADIERIPTPVPEVPEVPTPPEEPKVFTPPAEMSEADCRAAVRMLLEATPSASLSATIEEVEKLGAGKPDIKVLREEWWAMHQERKDGARNERDEKIRAWLREVFRAVQQKRDLPSQDILNKECQAQFQLNAPWPLVKEVRAEVLGAWSKELVLLSVAERYWHSKAPVDLPALPALVAVGAIQSIKSGARVYTSEQAIDDYLAHVPVRPPVVVQTTPVTKEPTMSEKDMKDMKERLARIEAKQAEIFNLINVIAANVSAVADHAVATHTKTTDQVSALAALLKDMKPAGATSSPDGLLSLVQSGQIRVVLEPVTK